QRFRERIKFGCGPGFDAVMLMRWAQHELRGAAICLTACLECSAKWRGDGDAALGVQPVLVGAEEIGHPAARPASPAVRPAAVRQRARGMSCDPTVWDAMGYHGLKWASKGNAGFIAGPRIFF